MRSAAFLAARVLAVVETGAHVDRLANPGRLRRDDVEGLLRYSAWGRSPSRPASRSR